MNSPCLYDVESTMNFYQSAFNLKLNFLHESKQYGELNTGDTKIAFASNEMAQSNGVKFIANDLKTILCSLFPVKYCKAAA